MTKFDLRSALNQVVMDPSSVEKTTFVTRQGLLECLVMPFGLTNAVATFQRLVNSALHGLLDVICIAYLDDIVVYSDDLPAHVGHVRQVLKRLVEHCLFIKAEKSEFSVSSTIPGTHYLSCWRVNGLRPGCRYHILPAANFSRGVVPLHRSRQFLQALHQGLCSSRPPTDCPSSKVVSPDNPFPKRHRPRRIPTTLVYFCLACSTSPLRSFSAYRGGDRHSIATPHRWISTSFILVTPDNRC